jgi:uncharacterized short protein YbdD (DUF466 family)
MRRLIRSAERLRAELARAWRVAAQTARLAIGLPDYDAYCAHVRECHPDGTPMTREQFAVARMESRYARGASRCC